MNHVLIVDDNPTNLRVLRAMLLGHGYEVVEAHHGAEALAQARQSTPHLIISDLLMPVMDGYTLLRHWKLDGHLKKIPFIVYTATYTEPADEQLAFDLGADAFIVKPAAPEPFMTLLHEVLAKHERGELAEPREPSGDEMSQLKEYSEVLIRKLELKMGELEQANRALERDITARKQTEEALRESRALFQAVIDGTTDAIIVKNLQGQYMLLNHSAERFAGKSAAEVLGKDDRAFFPPAVAAAIMAGDLKVIEGGKVNTYEEIVTVVSGEAHTFLATKGPIFDANGKVSGLFGISRDITARKQAEEALRIAEAKYRTIVETEPECVKLLDREGRLLEMNPAGLAMIQATSDQIRGERAVKLVAEEHQAAFNEMVEAVFRGEARHLVFDIIGLEGRRLTLETTSVPFRDGGTAGGVKALLGVARDITERKQAEEALRANEARLRLAMEAARQGWFELDLRTGQVVTSAEYVRIIGYDPATFTSNLANWLENVHPEDRAATRETLARCAASGQTCTAEYRRRTAAGNWLWFQSIGRVVERDPDGQPRRICGMHTDISDRIMQQQKLEQLLAQTVRDAQTKDELLREVNHRVTNNLSAVLGLMAFETEHVAHTKAHVVAPVLERLGQRIRGLLHVHRMLAQSAWAPVRVDQLAEQIIRAALSAASWRQQAVLAITPSALRVSPRQAGTLAMVINELATNTVKHAGQPAGAVKIGFEAEGDAEWITLRYRDNGPGYSPDVLANQQSNVGLKLINEMVAKTLRGSIAISNDHGAVATVRIRLEEETRT